MNDVVKNFKKGHKIHIKESQKGTFTKWCGGNVTDECIQRGKNSSNPKIRKKATFAANARKWKHKDGGFFLSLKVNKHQAFVPGATITDSNPKAYSQIKKHKEDTEWIDKSSKGLKVKSNLNPKYYQKRKVEKASKGAAFGQIVSNALGKVGNFLNSDTGKLAINGITSMIGTTVQNKAIDKQIEANNKMKEVDIQKAKLDKYRKLLGQQDMTPEIDSSGNIINKSSIVAQNNAYKQAMESTDTSEIQDTYDRVNRQLGNEKYMNQQGMLGDMVDTLSNLLGGKKKDNNSSNNSTSSNNSYFGNYVSTQYKNPGTYNSDGSFNTFLGTYKWENDKFKNINNTYGTFNADGSMNLGNFGTFSVKDGYKTKKLGILNS